MILIGLGIHSTSLLLGTFFFYCMFFFLDVCYRLINSTRVLDNQVCYNIEDANHIYDLCASRFKLHNIIYNHKVVRAIDNMIVDGLLAAEPYMKIAKRTFDAKKYLYLTDDIMSRIQSSEEPVRFSPRLFASFICFTGT